MLYGDGDVGRDYERFSPVHIIILYKFITN